MIGKTDEVARRVSIIKVAEQSLREQIWSLFRCSNMGTDKENLWKTILGTGSAPDSAEKPLGMLRQAQHERKISNHFNRSSVRPEALEG